MKVPVLNEIRYVFRSLCQNPGFALTAILSIALAIGANSTIFSYADGLLLRPAPVPNPSRLVILRSLPPSVSSPMPGTGQSRMSYPDFEEFRRGNKSFEGVVAFDQLFVSFDPSADGTNAHPQFRLGSQVSGDFFRVLQVEPQLGRGFRPEEDETPGKDPVVVLSYDFWKNAFAENPSVIGHRVLLNNVAFTIIGVAPESFTGADPFTRQDFYVPIAMASKLIASFAAERTDRSLRWFVVYGRLKPGISIRAAAQETSALAKSLEQSYPATNRGFGATVSTEREMRLVSWPILGSLVGALFTLALVILLIACANVANLMLGRGRARAREIAVRLAVGASRGRLLRLLLIESLLIALASGAVALLVARPSIRILSSIEIPSDLSLGLHFQIDERVFWFTVVVSAASTLLFGLLPAVQSTRTDLISVMKAGEPDQLNKRFFGSYVLVVVQIAGTMILLVLTTQGRRNFDDVLAKYPGFRIDHRLTMRFDPEASGYTPEQTQRFYDTLTQRAAEITGIKSAALTSSLPMTYDPERLQFIPEGYEFPPGRESAQALTLTVNQNYFETFGVPVLAGRRFLASDRTDAPHVALVNEAFAREYLGTNPIGKRMRVQRLGTNGLVDTLVEVVGVTMTGKTFLLIEPPVQVVYLPLSQNPRDRMTLIAETAGDPAAMAGPMEEMVRSIDPNISVFRVRTMEDIFERSSVNIIRTVGRIYDYAASLGLLLALVGLYAVVSYQVGRRTREIGIRMALGAERLQVATIFLREAMTMSLSGVSVGIVLSVFANRISESTLGAATLHPMVLGSVSLAMLLTTIAASMIPARRAARIDPQQALRQD